MHPQYFRFAACYIACVKSSGYDVDPPSDASLPEVGKDEDGDGERPQGDRIANGINQKKTIEDNL